MSPAFVRIINGEPAFAHSNAQSLLKARAVDLWFWIGQATSRTRPSTTESVFLAELLLSCANDRLPIVTIEPITITRPQALKKFTAFLLLGISILSLQDTRCVGVDSSSKLKLWMKQIN